MNQGTAPPNNSQMIKKESPFSNKVVERLIPEENNFPENNQSENKETKKKSKFRQ